jgi:hypothetical protein
MRRIDKYVGQVGEGRVIRDHPGEAHRRALSDRAEAKRAAHGPIEQGARHLPGPVALARQPPVHAVKVDARQIRRDLNRRARLGLRRRCHDDISCNQQPRNRKAALGARLADALAQSSVIALAPALA